MTMQSSKRKSAALTRPQASDARAARMASSDPTGLRNRAFRVAAVFGITAAGFVAVGAQLVRLGLSERPTVMASISRPLADTFQRPDIVDRNGILLATDVVMQSLFADPATLLGARETLETLETLETVLPGIATPDLSRALSDRKRRFVWVRRSLAPATAQRIHDLGLPGLDFKPEPKRSYPQGRVAGHLIGHVNVDNKGTSGIERYIDDKIGIEPIVGEPQGGSRQLRLTIDLAAQSALEAELATAMTTYRSTAASCVIMDVETGAVRAAASLPSADPGNPVEAQHLTYLDRLKRGTYELGSIFKAVTIAMALERRTITTRTRFDVATPIEIGRFRIAERHVFRGPISVAEIFVRSSNVGAGRIALEVGAADQRAFLAKLGLLTALETDAGATAEPQVPANWGPAETVTIAYGHGLAVAPLQFAAAGATLVNGGFVVRPAFVEPIGRVVPRKRVLSAATSAAMRRLMRLNVTAQEGSGGRARVPGYEVGGKTGTADRAASGGYDGGAVVTSFFAAFPMSAPRFVVLVTLHDPQGSGAGNQRFASLNAAPATARIIERLGPLLGVVPNSSRAESRLD